MRKTGRRLEVAEGDFFPAYVVWEITLRCDQPCTHCGSRAGRARPDELSTPEALRVVDELAAMGAHEVVLIGGEAYLHAGFLDIVRALVGAGIRVGMTTGGRGLTASIARAMKAAGMRTASVSVDGLEEAHDAIRGAKGSYASALAALGHLRDAGLQPCANTHINRVNRGDLEGLFDVLADHGVVGWQVQITAALGRAADRPEMLLQPYDLLDVMPRIAAIKALATARGMRLMPGNNLGYFGPEEAVLRSVEAGGRDHFQGCQAGRLILGIESDGAVKGCPSLQTRAYVGGSVKDRSLREIWNDSPELAFARSRTVDDLWGFCRTCPFAEPCLGGCSFTAHALFGRPGNNPYCHFRAKTLAAEGRRERLVPTSPAAGAPFDHGLFEIVVEPLDGDEPQAPARAEDLLRITRKPRR